MSRVGDAMLVRGGAVDAEVEPIVKVTVLTAAGSPMLDLKARLELPLSSTVGELKAAVEAKMAGRPPVARQRLVFGPKLLADDAATLGSLLAPSPADAIDEFDDEDVDAAGSVAMPQDLSIMLDMIPPLPLEKSPPAALEAKLRVRNDTAVYVCTSCCMAYFWDGELVHNVAMKQCATSRCFSLQSNNSPCSQK